eukprot:1160065-Pelagomonas_calceolata.AAC.1
MQLVANGIEQQTKTHTSATYTSAGAPGGKGTQWGVAMRFVAWHCTKSKGKQRVQEVVCRAHKNSSGAGLLDAKPHQLQLCRTIPRSTSSFGTKYSLCTQLHARMCTSLCCGRGNVQRQGGMCARLP